ncbi:Uncharacterised protein [Bordetella pertussis]|nr:Uncharacterised protein [Bordetella pertussis]
MKNAAARPLATVSMAAGWSLVGMMRMSRLSFSLACVSQRILLVPAVETTVLPFMSSSFLRLDDFLAAKRVAVTKVVGANATCCWRSTVLVAEPQTRSTVPLATSGMRVDEVTGTRLTLICAMPSLALMASTAFSQISIE